ncbi:tetratricopeptide repeat protein [Streptomyces sp. NPDC057695]|uniref:tetratricopeptide repeat protein n=1 Tax=Streptomyces sp. NPDC057695 TaxID=3346217 RepID=UPI0036AAC255
MSEASVPLVPVVSWPQELEPGRRYLVTVDVRLDADAPSWPYDREEFAIGCMLVGRAGMTVEALGATTVVLHRFGGTYGPARFLAQVEALEEVSAAASASAEPSAKVAARKESSAGAPEEAPAPAPEEAPQLSLTLITEGGVPFHTVALPVRRAARTDDPEPDIDLPVAPPEGKSPPRPKPPAGRGGATRRSVPRGPRDPRSRRDRVLGVLSPGGGDRPAVTSGYLIGPSLVLTCAHTVPRPGAEVRIADPGSPVGWSGTVLWRGHDDHDDAALVGIDDPSWQPSPDMSQRWGFLATSRPSVPGKAWGVTAGSAWGEITGPVEYVIGSMEPSSLSVRHRYVFAHADPPPVTSRVPWAGMSGGAVFCGDLLTGIVSADASRQAGRTHWEAVPVRDLLRDPSFRDVLARHAPGSDTEAEGVEWQELHEPADNGTLFRFRSPAALLLARHQVLAFRGRESLMADMRRWLDGPGTGLLLLHGAGGQGKTRIAQQLANLANADGWGTVWLRRSAERHDARVLRERTISLLIVVDYAETRLDQVTQLLETLARDHNAHPVRLLLLARSAGDWWHDAGAASSAAGALVADARVLALPPLEPEPGDARADAYWDAVLGYADHLPRVRGWEHHPWPGIARRLLTQDRLPELDAPGMSTALALHAKALADLLDTASQEEARPFDDPAESPSSVDDRLLSHEEHYWVASAHAARVTPGLPMSVLSDALVAAFLLGAADPREAQELLRRVPSLARESADSLERVGSWIADLYPVTGGYWGSLEPDRLAERFVGRRLMTDPGLADRLVGGAGPAQIARLLSVWTRAATHPAFQPELARSLTDLCVRHSSVLAAPAIDAATRAEQPGPLLDALRRLVDASGTPLSELERLSERLPRRSSTLAGIAARLSEVLTDRYRESVPWHPEDLVPLARSLNTLAIRLREVGRRAEALSASAEAVRIRRDLAAADPSTHLPDLAAGLNNLAVQLGEMGRGGEALIAITEAADLHRRLAEADPEAFLPDLAGTLNNLAVQLGEMGRGGEALIAITQAADLHRRLAEANPEAFLPDLAGTLNNLAVQLGATGRGEEALAAITEATALQRTLAQANPDAHLPNLAMSLNNLANHLGDVGRREKALTTIAEAVRLYRALSEGNPAAFLPSLADSLNNYAVRSDEAGRHQESLAAITEAVGIRRHLVERHPAAFLPDLADALNNLAVCLGRMERQDEALPAVAEAVRLYRALSDTHPAAFLPRLADSLNNLSVQSDDVGRHEEALAAITQAVDIRRRLAEADPDAHSPNLAVSLHNLAVCLGHLGRPDEALSAVYEAVHHYRALSQANPDAFRPPLAQSLDTLSAHLHLLRRTAEASEAEWEAERLRDPRYAGRHWPGISISRPTRPTHRDPRGGPLTDPSDRSLRDEEPGDV